MKKKSVAVVALLLSSVQACSAAVRNEDTADLGGALGPGVQCFLAPSGYYRPGTVFRIDPKGVPYIANKSLAQKIPVDSKPAAVGTLSGKQTFSVGILASLLDLVEGGKNLASANGSMDRSRTLDAKLEHVTLEVTDDTQIDQVIDWFNAYQHRRKNNDYYVVREAYVADAMGLKITKELKADLGGEATFKKAIQINGKLNYTPGASYELTAPFGARLYVCMKPEKLVLESAGISGSQYRAEAVTQRLAIKGDGGVDN